ncbi:MAG: hypothetical protein EBX52_13995 [Proteobacteria bacterium]|nr:hypothetical protein [Pseudomonadota bacterium]
MQLVRNLIHRALPLLVMLVLTACGRAQYNIQGMSSSNYQEGSLTVSSGSCYGSSDSLYYNGKSYGVSGASSQAARDVLNQLAGNSGGVAAYSSTYCTKTYRVWFTGSLTRGPCPTYPNSQCDLVVLNALQAF